MSIKINMSAKNLDPQIQKTTLFQTYAEEEYKKAMRTVLAPIKARVKENAPVMGGSLKKEIWSRVSGVGSNIVGRIANGDSTWYGNVVEYGRHKTKKQPPAEVIAEKYNVPLNEAFAIARSIAKKDANARVPVGFFAAARESAFQAANTAIAGANEIIVNKMVVK